MPSSSFLGCAAGALEAGLEVEVEVEVEVVEFWRIDGGLGLISGPGLRFRDMSAEEVSCCLSGTVELERSAGFLCVIWLLSTFFRPEVTDSPRLSCSKTAPMSPAPPFAAAGAGPGGGGGAALLSKFGNGGGGGGGAPPIEEGVAGMPLEVESASVSRLW